MSKLKILYILWSIGLLVGIMLWVVLSPAQAQPLTAIIAIGLLAGLIYMVRQPESAELRGRQHLYHALFEQNNDAIYWVDFNGTIIRVNQQACDLLGYEAEEFPSLTMGNIIVATEVSHAQNSLQKLLRGERVPIYERTMRRKDEQLRNVEINIQMVYDK